ncbi:MAG: hypothetical protein QOD59_3800, partial [Mycobacterium sp.]|nr:hypothetical protein [Mycobacterium sp.]
MKGRRDSSSTEANRMPRFTKSIASSRRHRCPLADQWNRSFTAWGWRMSATFTGA